MGAVLSDETLRQVDASWRAANYLDRLHLAIDVIDQVPRLPRSAHTRSRSFETS